MNKQVHITHNTQHTHTHINTPQSRTTSKVPRASPETKLLKRSVTGTNLSLSLLTPTYLISRPSSLTRLHLTPPQLERSTAKG